MAKHTEKALRASLGAALVCGLLVFAGRSPAQEGVAGNPADSGSPGASSDSGSFSLQGFKSLDILVLGGGGADPVPGTPPPPPDQPVAGYDSKMGGFFVQTKDGKTRINFNARIQPRYTLFLKDGQDGLSNGSDEDESYFELERARIGLSGHFFSPEIKFKVEIDGETDAGDKGALTDAYVAYQACAAAQIGIGQFKPYFLREEATSSGRLQRVERSLSNEFFNIDRNIGVWVEGPVNDLLWYSTAITNGIDTVNQATGGGGTQLVDQNPAFIGKLDFYIMGSAKKDQREAYTQSDIKKSETALLVLGGSFVYEEYEPSQVGATTFIANDADVISYGLDGIWKYKGASISGDYVGRWYNGETDGLDALYAHGYNLQGGYMVTDTIEVNFRLSGIFRGEGANNGTATEVGPGVNWFFAKNHNGKVQMDVAWVDISGNLPSGTENIRQTANTAFGSTAAGFSEGEQGVLTRIQTTIGF